MDAVIAKDRNLQDILTKKQLNHIISQISKTGSHLLKYELRSACDGIAGFLGDHFRVTLHFKEEDSVKKSYLFIKTIPYVNAPKAVFINERNFFRRESLTFKLFEEISDEEFSGPNPWGMRSILHNDNILVLPDISVEGYKTYPADQYLDMDHIKVILTALAHFHAAFAKQQTQSCNGSKNYVLPEDYRCFCKDPQFFDCPWLHAGIKTTANFLEEFSSNLKQYAINLEESITKWFIDACDSIKEYEDTLNVIIHKDLWANNILIKYNGDEPVNAVLIDFQCSRFAPPAFDVMIFLYYTTSRKFREQYENEVLNHYYTVFAESLDESTKNRLSKLDYDRQAFLSLCEIHRPGGMVVPMVILPFVLMSPLAAQKAFDDPLNFQKHFLEDRSGPVLGYARENKYYKDRVLEIFEEFVQMHL